MMDRAKNKGMEHPAFQAQRWKPGQSGNPKGKAARVSFEELVGRVLDERLPSSDMTKREALARLFVDEMLHRQAYAIKVFVDREWPASTLIEMETKTPVAIDIQPTPERLLRVAEIVREITEKAGSNDDDDVIPEVLQ